MLLSIITGTYNRLSYLRDMVESARKSMPETIDYEFVVVDGGSTDGTLAWMKEQEDIRVIEHGELKGGIKAFNDAGAAATGDYLLVANDDITFQDLSIAYGLAFMLDNPDVGAGCFFQDRGGREWHVESMPIYYPGNPEAVWMPYLQVGLIPKWLWDKCGGWGDWGGHTYGGDNYLSARVYESGYRIVPIDACKISDKKADDDLRKINNDNRKPDKNLWETFPEGFKIAEAPIYPNPLPERKRVLYAPIIESGHTIQKAQKRGLRDALGELGIVWEVDYVYAKESVVQAAEAWQPHYVITQFHDAGATTMDEVRRIKAACLGYMVNWSGDVWNNQASPELLEMLRYYDYHLTVNAALIPRYDQVGVRSGYWQNSFEPQVIEGEQGPRAWDVLFVGNNYQVEGAAQSRMQLAQMVKDLPCVTAVFGRGYPEGIAAGESLYDFKKTGDLYRNAKIGIADNQFIEADGFFSDRAFMILAAGGCMMMHQKVQRMEELAGFVDGVHYVEWTDRADLKAKIAYYLDHEDERKRIADAGTLECRTNHTFKARVQQLKVLLDKIPKKKPTISAMMIVKNEIDRIAMALSQLKWADEIVVVDTGSTDGTLKYLDTIKRIAHPEGAMTLGPNVFSMDWSDDFSAARNFAKSKCTGDWIFWLDADDLVPPNTRKRLSEFNTWSFRKMGVTNPGAFKMKVVNYTYDEPGYSGLQTRLFKNIESIEWRGRIHETVDESIAEIGIVTVGMAKVEILHQGETDPVRLEQKQMRNLKILALDPPSPWNHYQRGVSYGVMGRWADAIIWFQAAMDYTSDPELTDFLRFMEGYGYYQMGIEYKAGESFKLSKFPDAFYMLAEVEAKHKRKDNAIPDLYRKFLKAKMPTLFPTFMDLWKPAAKERLLAWHQEEVESLTAA